ncbi:MAG: hypothetical protein EA367_06070 [Leptolyngbya sp. DLM2.Bin15]|nr:MAG: hypothetical protein EA367_06070 [Leptolyngbya sp. DLM2.Bin15]
MSFFNPSSHPGFTKLGPNDIVPNLSLGMLQRLLLRPELAAGATEIGVNLGALAPYDTVLSKLGQRVHTELLASKSQRLCLLRFDMSLKIKCSLRTKPGITNNKST